MKIVLAYCNLIGDDVRVIERNTDILNACKDIGLSVKLEEELSMQKQDMIGV